MQKAYDEDIELTEMASGHLLWWYLSPNCVYAAAHQSQSGGYLLAVHKTHQISVVDLTEASWK